MPRKWARLDVHRGQTSEHAREIAQGSHCSIHKTLHVAVTTAASSCELEAKFSYYFNESSSAMLGRKKRNLWSFLTWIISMLKYAFVLIFPDNVYYLVCFTLFSDLTFSASWEWTWSGTRILFCEDAAFVTPVCPRLVFGDAVPAHLVKYCIQNLRDRTFS